MDVRDTSCPLINAEVWPFLFLIMTLTAINCSSIKHSTLLILQIVNAGFIFVHKILDGGN